MRVGAAIEDVGKLGPAAWLEERDYESQGHRLFSSRAGELQRKEGDPGKSKARRINKEEK